MIKELTLEEAAQLREMVKHRFQEGPFNGTGFRITQYKEGYQALADDIKNSMEGDATSISTHRLRKLFFYADPVICPAAKLEKPSFGNDFIQALFQYVDSKSPIRAVEQVETMALEISHPEQEPAIVQDPKSMFLKRKWRWAVLLLLFAIAVIAWRWMRQPEYWTEEFDSVSVDSLKSRGWEILDYDSVSFSQQLKPGYFTAYTHRGDYWFTQPDTPIITNLLIKRINAESGKITLKINDFNPYMDFQQAGIFLMDKDQNPNHNIRITVVVYPPAPFRQAIQIIKTENGTAYEIPPFILWSWESGVPPPTSQISPLWIQIQYEKNKFRFYYHFGEAYASFRDITSVDFNFEPTYVALGAFRGIRNSQRSLNNSTTIPVLFDCLKVEPLPE